MAAYLDGLHAEAPDIVAKVAEGCRRKLKTPKLTREEYIAVLMKNGCQGLAQALANRWSVECPVVAKDGTLHYATERSFSEAERQQAWQPKALKAFKAAG